MKKRGDWDYNTFNYLREGKKSSSKIQMYLRALLNEFMTQSLWNTVCGTDPGVSKPKSPNSLSIRKTKGKLLKASQGFELNWCHHATILCLFLSAADSKKRCTNFDILNNKSARLTNISPNRISYWRGHTGEKGVT